MTPHPTTERLQADLASADALLALLPAFDPLGRLSLEAYRDELVEALDDIGPDQTARVELVLGRGLTSGAAGIRADILADVIGGLHDLVSRLWGDRGGAPLAVTALASRPGGVVLEEVGDAGDRLFASPLRRAVTAAIEHLDCLAHGTDDEVAELIETLEPRVLHALREFAGRLSRQAGTCDLAQAERAVHLDGAALEQAWQRLEAAHIDEAPLTLTGRLLGLMPLARRFEFQPDDGRPALAGRASEAVCARYLTDLEGAPAAGRRWTARLARVTVNRPGFAPVERFTLTELEPEPERFTRV